MLLYFEEYRPPFFIDVTYLGWTIPAFSSCYLLATFSSKPNSGTFFSYFLDAWDTALDLLPFLKVGVGSAMLPIEFSNSLP